MKNISYLLAAAFLMLLPAQAFSQASGSEACFNLQLESGAVMTVDFYGTDVFRLFCDPAGGEMRDPQPAPPARILIDHPRRPAGLIECVRQGGDWYLWTDRIVLIVSPDGRFRVGDPGAEWERNILESAAPVSFGPEKTILTLKGSTGARYYGGGIQNGRYDHTGKTIAIENQNSWTDGGVCSPAPWFWSTAGYGILWNTFAKGTYSFSPDGVVLTHDTPWLDIYVMVPEIPSSNGSSVGSAAQALLDKYYQLTGFPVLLPKFGFYEGHLNAYNRDYWAETAEPGKGIPFEDGKRYIESQTDNGGIRESLNGELPGNYPFSARAVIDRYEAADMPLGWILPNDGYGAGYGQTETLAGNVQNLKEFGDYARSKGVEIGLWTQSDLHPIDTIPALLQRDIVAEVRDAGVRVLKTDVAWVGWGYSFGLNGIADAAQIMPEYGSDARPFIITLDGWAGTHRYAGVWSGDQVGGNWEYIRFHIPTYIGAGLSGQPNITSDMDGIFGGKNEAVNIRDFQWKTFTPMQLNMDGWGSNEKYPQALGARAADINRRYLKLKSALMPYTYSIAHEAVTGLPMIRAMELEDEQAAKVYTTRYQFLYGPSFLVAPVYQNTAADADGNDTRCGIYLPEGRWMDYFTGEVYDGGIVLGNFAAPLDKLPVFLREGAIVPMTAPHNNPSQMDKGLRIYDIFPGREASSFTEYDDDGRTQAYLDGACATTQVSCKPWKKGLRITIAPTEGGFDGFVKEKATQLRIRCSGMSEKSQIKAYASGKTKLGISVNFDGKILTIDLSKVDITKNELAVDIQGLILPRPRQAGVRIQPDAPVFAEPEVAPTTIDLRWKAVPEAECYEVVFDGIRYTGITDTHYRFEGLTPGVEYGFNLMALGVGRAKSLPVFQAVTTSADPLQWAIPEILATCTAQDQPGQELSYLFNHDTEKDLWHTVWGQSAAPFTIHMDLGAIYTLDKMEYYPRTDAGNGTITSASVSWSRDGSEWTEPQYVTWPASGAVKTFSFDGNPQARFVRLYVSRALGGFGSGRELLIYRVPGTEAYRGGVFNEKGEAVESL